MRPCFAAAPPRPAASPAAAAAGAPRAAGAPSGPARTHALQISIYCFAWCGPRLAGPALASTQRLRAAPAPRHAELPLSLTRARRAALRASHTHTHLARACLPGDRHASTPRDTDSRPLFEPPPAAGARGLALLHAGARGRTCQPTARRRRGLTAPPHAAPQTFARHSARVSTLLLPLAAAPHNTARRRESHAFARARATRRQCTTRCRRAPPAAMSTRARARGRGGQALEALTCDAPSARPARRRSNALAGLCHFAAPLLWLTFGPALLGNPGRARASPPRARRAQVPRRARGRRGARRGPPQRMTMTPPAATRAWPLTAPRRAPPAAGPQHSASQTHQHARPLGAFADAMHAPAPPVSRAPRGARAPAKRARAARHPAVTPRQIAGGLDSSYPFLRHASGGGEVCTLGPHTPQGLRHAGATAGAVKVGAPPPAAPAAVPV